MGIGDAHPLQRQEWRRWNRIPNPMVGMPPDFLESKVTAAE